MTIAVDLGRKATKTKMTGKLPPFSRKLLRRCLTMSDCIYMVFVFCDPLYEEVLYNYKFS